MLSRGRAVVPGGASQFSTERQNAMSSILKKLSPGLQGKLALKIHEDWLAKMTVFSEMTLPTAFYVAVAKVLSSQLFAPMEVSQRRRRRRFG